MPESSGNHGPDPQALSLRPQLIYDGDCGFCAYWARYWEKLTGDKVEYRPYQQVATQHPAISEAEFRRAVQFVAPDGRRASAAEASFLTLSHASGNLSALSYHFLTQPLPTPLAWYAAGLPPSLSRVATGAVFVVELGLPFLIFCPRRLRFVSAFGILVLQICILLTGNYNWFNLQTMLLCLPLIDDAWARRMLPPQLLDLLAARATDHAPRRAVNVVIKALALLMVFLSLVQMDLRFGGSPPDAAVTFDGWFEPLHLVSPYGLFAVMTTVRDEIVIQGSNDGVEWRDYEFRYKPGDIMRRPRWNIPHQPRLDWQMWFAALDDPERQPWFSRFLVRLLENEPSVTGLLERNPFPDRAPTYVRAQFYEYTYASSAEHSAGQWWDRRLLGLYFPQAHLNRQ